MANQVITRIAPWSVFRLLFLTGTTVFGLGGIFLGLLEKDALGILGGAFLGLLGGLCTAVGGTVYCVVLNLLAPLVGGIEVELTSVNDSEESHEPENETTVSS